MVVRLKASVALALTTAHKKEEEEEEVRRSPMSVLCQQAKIAIEIYY